MCSFGKVASQDRAFWSMGRQTPEEIAASKEVAISLILFGVVLSVAGACATAIGGAFSICLGALVIGGIILAAGILFSVLKFCLTCHKEEKRIILAAKDLLKTVSIQEEQTAPLIEQASYAYEAPISSPEDIQQKRPLVLRKSLDSAASSKFVVVGDRIRELVKVGSLGAKGERILEKNINAKQSLVRVWNELFILGREGEVVRLDGFCCKILSKETNEDSSEQDTATKES